MVRVAAHMAALAFVLGALVAPAAAQAAGCDELRQPRERIACESKAAARAEAHAELQRRRSDTTATRSGAWQHALDEANGVDVSGLLQPRPLATVVGLAWFFLLVRGRWRSRVRARRA